MIRPDQFRPAYLGDATVLSLLLPINSYGSPYLLAPSSGHITAISLSPPENFHSFDATNNKAYRGILIPDVEIEMDIDTAFDFGRLDAPLGSLCRRAAMLGVNGLQDGMMRSRTVIPIVTDLPESSTDIEVGFTRWSVVLGQGPAKVTLMEIDRRQGPTLASG